MFWFCDVQRSENYKKGKSEERILKITSVINQIICELLL